MEVNRQTRQFSLVTMDLTGHCDRRCVYCYNRWGGEQNMSMPVFQKILQILPYTREGAFLLSCLYEPSLNPLFFDMVEQIPRQYNSKVSLSTNLAHEMSEEDFKRLACSNIHHINVSLPSFEAERYFEMTGVDGAVFFRNLALMREVFDRYPKRPRLHLVTMAVKSNREELPGLVERAKKELRPYSHEVRSPQLFREGDNVLLPGHYDSTRLEEEMLSRRELNELSLELRALGQRQLYLDFSVNKEGAMARTEALPNPHDPYVVHFFPSGQGLFLSDENPIDLDDIDYPFVFFQRALTARQTHQATLRELRAPLVLEDGGSDRAFLGMIDTLTIWDERFVEVQGWALHRELDSSQIYLVLEALSGQLVYRAEMRKTPETAILAGAGKAQNCGFSCLIDPEIIPYEPRQNYRLLVGVMREDKLVVKHLTDLSF